MSPIPESYLVPPAARAEVIRALPELHYPARVNLAVELLDRHLQRGRGHRPAYYYEDRTVTYDALARRVNRVGNALRRLGVRAGDRVMVRMPDCPDLVVALLAAWRIGAVAVPTYVNFRAADLLYREHDTEARVMIVAESLIDEVAKAESGFRFLDHIVVAPEAGRGGYRDLARLEAEASETLAPEASSRDDVATIIYTSGSTGEPKGAYHTHAELLAMPDSYGRYALHVTEADVFCGQPPIPFGLGLEHFVLLPLRSGAAAVLTPLKQPLLHLEAIARHRVSIFVAVPTFYNMILQVAGQAPPAYRLDSLRRAEVGGEPLTEAVFTRWREWAGIPLTNLIGCTELINHVIGYREEDQERTLALGRPLPGWQLAVRDPKTFAEVPRGTAGLLTARGPSSIKYWRKPDRQAEAVREGWNRLNDLVRMDEKGWVHFGARADDLIISSGYNIAPQEVEAVLLRHPAVRECACVGVPDPHETRPTVVKACVVLREGVRPGPELARELQDFVKQNAAPHLYPRVIEFVSELPETVSGKTRRLGLR